MKNIRYYISILLGLSFLGTALAQTTYRYDPSHTHAYFRADHLGISYTFGRFNEMDATLVYDADNLDASSIEFIILTESVDTGIDLPDNDFDGARRNGHLRSPDFFDAAQFPTLTFVSKSISATDQENMFEVVGDLTIHGVTNEINIMVEKTGEAQNQQGQALIGFYTEFDIDRTDYGMTNLLQASGPMVRIMLSFEGVAQ